MKKRGGGKKTHSVLDGVLAWPICISRPNRPKCLCMRASPRAMSSCDEKMKAPSSTYRHWNISTVVRWGDRYSFGRWPRMRPSPAASLDPTTELTVQTRIFAFLYLLSNVSAKADIRNRKSTEAMLLPCLTPTDWGISMTSFSIFRTMTRSLYMRSIAETNHGERHTSRGYRIVSRGLQCCML